MAPLSCVCSKGGVLCSCLSLSPAFIVPHRSLFSTVVGHSPCWLFPVLVVPQSWLFPAVWCSPLLLVVPHVGHSPCWSFLIIGHSSLLVIPVPHHWLFPFPVVCHSLHLSFPPGCHLLLMGLIPAIHCSLCLLFPVLHRSLLLVIFSTSIPPYERGLASRVVVLCCSVSTL